MSKAIPMTLEQAMQLSRATNGVFQGTMIEKEMNLQTHSFDEERCMWCDCRPNGVWSEVPCPFWLDNMTGRGQISDWFPHTAISTQPDMEWTKVVISVHTAGIDGERFFQVSGVGRNSSFFVERYETADAVIKAFREYTAK